MSPTRRDLLRRLLCPMWLRAESAAWYAHEAFVAREFLDLPLKQPSLELGCMEGVSTFVMLGGQFGLGFDVYQEAAWARDSHRWQSSADDYFDTSVAEGGEPDIVERPSDRFTVGLSWKRSHLDKAARLGTYEELVEHDPNTPLTMFADDSFATIWAPNLYWVDELEGLLAELRRVLDPGGRLVTVLPDRAALDHMLYRFADTTDRKWIENLDRGRHQNIARQARSLPEWSALFDSVGLLQSRHADFLPKVVFEVNDIGLRPLFPVLMNVYETLAEHRPDDLTRIKGHWIDVAFDFLAPLCDVEWMDKMSMQNVWNVFELRKGAAA